MIFLILFPFFVFNTAFASVVDQAAFPAQQVDSSTPDYSVYQKTLERYSNAELEIEQGFKRAQDGFAKLINCSLDPADTIDQRAAELEKGLGLFLEKHCCEILNDFRLRLGFKASDEWRSADSLYRILLLDGEVNGPGLKAGASAKQNNEAIIIGFEYSGAKYLH